MYDLIIIGSGPAGLSAAIYAKRSGLDTIVLEKAAVSGGQVLTTYEVDNYLGFPSTDGFELGQAFRRHADRLGVVFKSSKVLGIEDRGEIKIVRTRKEEFEARAIILATGAYHKTLDVPGEEEFTGRGVSYCATCDGAFFKGKRAAVVGGGDVALEDAIYLSALCEKVYVIHRRDEFRGAHILRDELAEKKNVEILFESTVKQIEGGENVEALIIRNERTKEESRLCVDAVFIAVGIVPDSGLVKDIAECDEAGYIVAGEDCATSAAGIFAAGDVRKKQLRQIITAAADGANAASGAALYCRKNP